ncbi:MAG: ammonia channel protein, partial [Bacteroidota bacterium]|nr:ammonia channel protein [Bacteroidota bacterium]
MTIKIKYAGLALLGLIAPTVLLAQETAVAVTEPTPYIDFGNTAWMIVATALVMLMTIPGLALFYGGLVRQKNVLNILMQCFILTAVITLEWVFFGYSLAFSSSTGVLAPYIGGFDWVFLNGIGINDVSPYFIS